MRAFKLIIFFFTLLISLWGCFSGPKKISSYRNIEEAGEIASAESFAIKVDTVVLEEEIPGKYIYLIEAGGADLTFLLDHNYNFAAVYHNGNAKPKRNMGIWKLNNNRLKLKKKGIYGRWYTLQPYRIGPLIFLVPQVKQNKFIFLINEHKEQISYVSKNYDRLRPPDLIKELWFLKNHCLIKEKRL